MAAEAIETEAKKTRLVGEGGDPRLRWAGNAITPEEVAEADLVIVAADIEVDWRNSPASRCTAPPPVWR